VAIKKGAIYFICGLGFLAYLTEGSIGDWITLYFRDDFGANSLMSALSFSVFSLLIAAVRFATDYLVLYFSRIAILLGSGIVGSLGLLLTVFASFIDNKETGTGLAIFGMAVCGAGLGPPAAIVLAMAGDIEGMEPSDGIALVSSMSYAGLVVGPPLLGTYCTQFNNILIIT
jgi:MFS family permease